MTNLRLKVLPVLACAVLFSACASVPPPKLFTGDRQSSAIHDLSVAVLLPRVLSISFNNDVTFEDISKAESPIAAGAAMGVTDGKFMKDLLESIFEPAKYYRSTLAIYYQAFKKVELVSSIDDPRVADADLLIVPETVHSIGAPTAGTFVTVMLLTLDTGALWFPLSWHFQAHLKNTFYTPDHSLLATLKADSPKIKRKRPFFFMPDSTKDLTVLNRHAINEMDRQIQNSTELAQYARSLKGKKSARVALSSVTKGFASDVDKPGYALEPTPDNFAVVIGVEDYQNLPAARFAKRDAETIRAHLEALGYPPQNIALLTNAQATGNKVRSYVETWLPKNVTPASKVLFYFAGHGAPDPETKQGYLVPWDGDAQFLSDSGYPLKRLYEKLSSLQAKQVVVAMDSCFTGAGGRSVLAKGTRPLMTLSDDASGLGRVALLTAAGAGEITGDDESQGHGLFTYYLLQGFNERAGQGSLGQVYGLLKPKVEAAARQGNRSQSPRLSGETAEELTLR
ncbi:MAG: caspase family protein [Elusimicrobiota bacterium]